MVRLIYTYDFVKTMITRRYLIVLPLFLLLVPSIMAEPSYTFKQFSTPDLKITCFEVNSSLCNTAVSCYMTVYYPDLITLYRNATMSINGDFYNHSLIGLNKTGEYPTQIRCEGASDGFSTFTFEVTPTGQSDASILENTSLIIFGLLGFALVGFGAYFRNPFFGFIGAIMFLLGGVYTTIFGFNNVTDFYTQGVGITFIGLGMIFMFSSAYEWIWGDQ